MESKNQDRNPYNNGFEYGVRHLLSPKSGLVRDVLLSSVEISDSTFRELLELGSIYVSGQRLLEDRWIEGDTYIRLHTRPRRFPEDDQRWSERIVFENEDFIVVNKPAGLPVHASVDNRLENLQQYLSAHCQHELFVTHRLDVPTSGLLVFAKTKEFLSEFNRLLSERAVEKIYCARVSGAELNPGVYQHFMEPSPRAPKKVSTVANPEWQECRLKILSTLRLQNSDAKVGPTQEFRIELLTGRTHQIRAQLAALGCPIWGDHQYGSANVYFSERIDLAAVSLAFGEFRFSLPGTSVPTNF